MKKTRKILAPAGEMKALRAAVHAGADEVYLGGKQFSARRAAVNFSQEELMEAIHYCHKHDVRVFVTVNTLFNDDEFEQAMAWVDFLYRQQVDAVIVQDIGLAHAIRSIFPDLPLHASTQMTIHNLQGVLQAEQFGFQRVVLPREMSAEEIKFIHDHSSIELEVFCHGALCVSYSGQCLMSAYIGGRSANRGNCAQPCRKTYTLQNKSKTRVKEHIRLLSLKDLNTLDQIDLLDCDRLYWKIEGRMKNESYVYQTVRAYKGEAVSLDETFHRPFTQGFLMGERIGKMSAGTYPGNMGQLLGRIVEISQGMITIELAIDLYKGDEIQHRVCGKTTGARADQIIWQGKRCKSAPKGALVQVPYKYPVRVGDAIYKTYSVALARQVKQALVKEIKSFDLMLEGTVQVGSFCVRAKAVSRRTGRVTAVESCSVAPEIPVSHPTSSADIEKQLRKWGGTPYEVTSCMIDVVAPSFVRVGAINELRRELLEKLECQMSSYAIVDFETQWQRYQNEVVDQLALQVFSEEDIDLYRAIRESVCYPMVLTTSSRDQWEALQQENLKKTTPHKATLLSLEVTHWSQLSSVWRTDGTRWGSYTLLCTNFYAAAYYLTRGLAFVECSPEASTDQMARAFKKKGLPVLIVPCRQDPLVLMNLAYCPVGATLAGKNHCGLCQADEYELIDEWGERFPLLLDPVTCHAKVISDRRAMKNGRKGTFSMWS